MATRSDKVENGWMDDFDRTTCVAFLYERVVELANEFIERCAERCAGSRSCWTSSLPSARVRAAAALAAIRRRT
jgi:hypothetical protein